MEFDKDGPDVKVMREAVAKLLNVPAESVAGVVMIAAMVDGSYLLLHNAPTRAQACEVAAEVFSNWPHEHDEIVGVLL